MMLANGYAGGLVTQRRSVAKSVGYFQQCLSVCLSVCQHNNF